MRTFLAVACLLAGCAANDPLTSPRAWHPTGANDSNLQAMIADPMDLLNGAATPEADAAIAVAAIERYRAGKVRALPDSGVLQIVPVANGEKPAAAAAAGE